MLCTDSAPVSLPRESSSDESGWMDAMSLSSSSFPSFSRSMSARGVWYASPLPDAEDRDAAAVQVDVAELIEVDHEVVLGVGVAGVKVEAHEMP